MVDLGLTILVHLQDVGDLVVQQFGGEGTPVGTHDQARRLEGYALSFTTPLPNVGFLYDGWVQHIGPILNFTDGQFCGTRGLSRRLEAIRITLTGTMKDMYQVVYAAYLQDTRWTDVFVGSASTHDASTWCGTFGESRRIEAIAVKVTLAPPNGPQAALPYAQDDFESSVLKLGPVEFSPAPFARKEYRAQPRVNIAVPPALHA